MSWSEEDHVRHFMYESIFKVLSTRPWPEHRSVLDFAGKFYGDPDGGWQTHMRTMCKTLFSRNMYYIGATWPEETIENLSYQAESFDLSIADQILEHVERPWVAAAELERVTKKGGVCVVATPGLYPIHPSPLDCWRIMPDGYRVLFPESRWDYLDLSMWGNADRVGFEYSSNQAFPYGPPETSVQQAMQQPFYTPGSDGRCPIQIWWIGVKR